MLRRHYVHSRWHQTILVMAIAALSTPAYRSTTAQADDKEFRLHLDIGRHHDRDDDRDDDERGRISAGIEVLNSGPVHEAFAAPVIFDPEPGLLITRRPPAPIQEIPSLEKPAGDNVAWIAGYWSWNTDSDNFIWTSGVWRNIPPGRQWVPGYWTQADASYRWVAGAWTAASRPIEYLPTPPPSIDEGEVGDPPSLAHVWVPGVWLWRDAHYVWRPGYWLAEPETWVWTPAQYIWTPLGAIFVGGYWDYAVERRGLLFAPVVVQAAYDTRPIIYRPSVVVDVGLAMDYLFVRPNYRHYYFGDYYSDRYVTAGIYPNFAFHYSRFGYDPIYVHRLAVFSASDRHWSDNVRDRYRHLVANPDARPLRLYDPRASARREITVPLSKYMTRGNLPVRFERTDSDHLRAWQDRADETRQFQERRMRVESERPVTEQTRRDIAERRREVIQPHRQPELRGEPIEPRRETERSREITEPRRGEIDTRREEVKAEPQPFRLEQKSPIISRLPRELVKDKDQAPPPRPKVPDQDRTIKPSTRREPARRPDPQARMRAMLRPEPGEDRSERERR